MWPKLGLILCMGLILRFNLVGIKIWEKLPTGEPPDLWSWKQFRIEIFGESSLSINQDGFQEVVKFKEPESQVLTASATEIKFESFVWLEWYHTVRLLSDPYLGTISCNTRKPFRKRRSRKLRSHQYFLYIAKKSSRSKNNYCKWISGFWKVEALWNYFDGLL